MKGRAIFASALVALLLVGLTGCHASGDVDPDRAHDATSLHVAAR